MGLLSGNRDMAREITVRVRPPHSYRKTDKKRRYYPAG
jgi:hypothetical protein